MRLFQIKKNHRRNGIFKVSKFKLVILSIVAMIVGVYYYTPNFNFNLNMKTASNHFSKFSISEFSTEEGANAFIFSDNKGSLIVDASGSPVDAKRLIELVRSQGSEPSVLLITNGRSDYYWGLPTLKKAFPNLRVVVASQKVKDDIIHNVHSNDPTVITKFDLYPQEFDYQKEIDVLALKQISLPGGSVLDLNDYDLPGRPSITTLYSKELNAVFTSDLVYNQVHLLCEGISVDVLPQWKGILKSLKEKYGPLNATIYPGYGASADISVLDDNCQYLDDLAAAILSSTSRIEAKDKMLQQYPDYLNTGLFLDRSIIHLTTPASIQSPLSVTHTPLDSPPLNPAKLN
jgi:glyoxylase-like metal-dependent hydrolase (beta-lactamase superfamily II)